MVYNCASMLGQDLKVPSIQTVVAAPSLEQAQRYTLVQKIRARRFIDSIKFRVDHSLCAYFGHRK